MSFFQANPELFLSLAKLTSALLVAFAAAHFLKQSALRAAFWAGVFIILPTIIIVTHGKGNLNILPQLAPATSPVEVRLQQPAIVVSPSPNAEELPELARAPSVAPSKEINWVAIVFFIGMVFSLIPILVSLLRIRFMTKKPAGEYVMAAWEKIGPQIFPAVPLYLTNCPTAPFTAGMIHAAVVLPESSVSWSPRRLRSTLHHEAAHIIRRDSLIRVLASFVRALLWFHPLVWLAHRHLVAAQEEACDETVLAAGIPPDEYAEDLLQTAKSSQNALAYSLNMARWSQLGTRIQTILTKKQNNPKPITMKNIATVILGITAVTYSLSTLGFSKTPDASKASTDLNQVQVESLERNLEVQEGVLETMNPTLTKKADPKSVGDLQGKLNTIIIPDYTCTDMEIDQVIQTLSKLSAVHDPEGVGVNIVPMFNPKKTNPRVNITLRGLSLDRTLQLVTQQVDFSYGVTEDAVVIQKKR